MALSFNNTVAEGNVANGRNYIYVGYGITYGMTGHVQEIVMFNSILTKTQTQQVNTYLAVKNGITLGHDYINAAGNTVYGLTANNGYVANIAGIGKEAANGGLDQRQSNSVNTGKQVLIGTIGLTNSNSSNGTPHAEDQFLTWGDNGLARIPSVAISNIVGVNYRFAAIWKAQNTGSVGTVRVAWPAQYNNLTLVQSSDPTFASGNTATNMSANTVTINGRTYNYADVTLSSEQYFTFAATLRSSGGVVPVTLTDFRATLQTDNNVLLSLTASEINNSGFRVQRSANGASGWNSLGFVSSKATNGNSNTLLNYNYTDIATIAGATNYYRLQQEDLNENKIYSNVVSISVIGASAGLKIYPNPVYGVLNVSGIVIGNTAQIIAVNGQVCQQFTATATQQINVSNLAARVYILKTVASSGAIQSVKLVVK